VKASKGVDMIINHDSAKTTTPVPGIVRKILAHTGKVMLTEHTLQKGAVLPEHQHPHEQLVYLLSGELLLDVEGGQFKMLPGDSIAIPSNAVHKAAALKKSVALDIFAPARTDYL
jgi:quercetin dioxygenase-like cupin family protein